MLLRILLFFLFITNAQILFSQEYELVGLIDNKIYTIDDQTGEAVLRIEIKDLPSTVVLRDLVYHESKETFYSIANPTDQPYLAKISTSGEFEIQKRFETEFATFHSVEAISIYNDEIYFSASLNGGVNDNDFYAESLLKINKENKIEFSTEIDTEKPFPDIDAFHIYEDRIFIFDGAPPNLDFLEFYELSIKDWNTLSSPTNIYSSSYIPIADFCYFKDQLLFVAEKSIYTFNSSIQKLVTVSAEENFSGLTRFPACSLPTTDLKKKIIACNEEFITLDVENPSSSYLWSDGSTNSSLSVSKSGTYSVEITNSCGSKTFTTEVSLQSSPQQIDFKVDPVTCTSYSLSMVNHDNSFNYSWEEGIKDSTLTASETGWYKLRVSNNCGSKTDSLYIEIKDFSDVILPNIITPNGDQKNDKFIINEKLQSASISIFNRYGKLVYQNPRYINEWDSGKMNSGNYFYQITLDCGDVYKGWVEVRK